VTFHSGEKESRSVSQSRDNRRQNIVRKFCATRRRGLRVAVLVADFAVVVAVAIVETCLAHAVLLVPRATASSRWDQMAILRRNTSRSGLLNNPVSLGMVPTRGKGSFRLMPM
jgi:hypothetical protein